MNYIALGLLITSLACFATDNKHTVLEMQTMSLEEFKKIDLQKYSEQPDFMRQFFKAKTLERVSMTEKFEILINWGFNINASDADQKCPLYASPLHSHTRTKNCKVIESLLKHGADLEKKDRNGCTSLTTASQAITTYYISSGANFDTKDHNKATPLHYAVLNNESNTTQQLINKGANVNAKDADGNTPLHFIGKGISGSLKNIEILLAAGADPYIKNENGYTAAFYIKRKLSSIRDKNTIKELLPY